MALATAEAIRDRIYSLIESIAPTTDATKFRRYRNEWGADFVTAAEANPAAMLRRFQVREVSDDEPPETSGVTEERVTVRYQVLIAYPQSHRYGRDNAIDRDDVMNEDWKAINFKVGIYGRGNFSTSTDGSYDATPLGAVRDMERGEGVDLLVIDVPFEFYRATGVEAAADPAPSWTSDATSGKAVPADADEWSAFIGAKSLSVAAPDLLYLCQESSGDLSPAIGALDFSASGTVSYDNSVSGWSRKFVGTTDGTMGSFGSTDASLPDPATDDITILVLASVLSTPAAQRSLVELFTNADCRLRINTTPRLVCFDNPNSATGAADPTGQVRPYWLRYEQGSNTTGGSDAEKLTPTHAANIGKNVRIGAAFSNPPAARYGYVAVWFSAVSDADMKALLEAMGWTVSWS